MGLIDNNNCIITAQQQYSLKKKKKKIIIIIIRIIRITEMLGRFVNLNKMKTKRLSHHMSQNFIHNRT